jgi:hypothetical protein
MKKIFYLFALFSCVQIVLAQQDSSYLPLAVGNYWVLQNQNSPFDTFVIKVEKDTVLQNGIKYYYVPNFDFGFFRVGDSGKIYAYNKYLDRDSFRFRFDFQSSTKYCDSTFGCFMIRYLPPYIYYDYSTTLYGFLKGVGISGTWWDFGGYYLIKAVINNICLTCGPQVGIEKEYSIPKAIKLYQNYPNPFNPETKINFDIPETGIVKLKVFTITGQEINSLVDEIKQAGSYSVMWDGKDKNNLKLSSGVYFYQLTFSGTIIKQLI